MSFCPETLRDRKAVARYAGLTGSPDESGSKRREKGLSRSGNARVRKIMIQLAWRMVKFQPDSALVQWFKQRTENAKGSRKPMIVALARKLIIALWRYADDGVIPEGFSSLALQRRYDRQQEEKEIPGFGTSALIAAKRPRTIRGSGCPHDSPWFK